MSPSATPESKEEQTMTAPSTLELWQTEWCPASHRVRQRLTELGLTYTTRQVPVQRDGRAELQRATGASEIPVLIAHGTPVCGEQAILAYLDEHFIEPPDAAEQRSKAARAERKELEAACPKLAAATR
jgi:glutathione S-transferase